MSDIKARQLLSLLLVENGIAVPEDMDAAGLMRRYLEASPLPAATENALATVFDVAVTSPQSPPSDQG